jgi:ATP-dependent NAD(P)H-hydrate dehydratase
LFNRGICLNVVGDDKSMGNTPVTSYAASWSDKKLREEVLDRCILELDSSTQHKGTSGGRVAVLGGNKQYTGAPYYTAMAALRAGADLAYIYTAQEAAIPLKCYSPEFMVTSVYSASHFNEIVHSLQAQIVGSEDDNDLQEQLYHLIVGDERAQAAATAFLDAIVQQLSKWHSLVIGPGLGRCPLVLYAVSRVIQHVIALGKPPDGAEATTSTAETPRPPPLSRRASLQSPRLILDADALFLLSLPMYRNLLADAGHSFVVLTPNAFEYRRLLSSHGTQVPPNGLGNGSSKKKGKKKTDTIDTPMPSALSSAILIVKGKQDSIRFTVRSDPIENGKVLKEAGDASTQQEPSTKLTALKTVEYICTEEGGLKRSGGLGDILAGTLGTLAAWHYLQTQPALASGDEDPSEKDGDIEDDTEAAEEEAEEVKDDLAKACWAGCCFVKQATKEAFRDHGRAMTAPEVLKALGPTMMKMVPLASQSNN